NNSFDWKSNIINTSVRPDFTYYLNTSNTIKFGGLSTYYVFKPGEAKSQDEGNNFEFGLPDKYALENAIYLENEQKIKDKLTIRYGIRVSNFNYLGKGTAYQLERNELARRSFVKGIDTFGSFEVIQSYWVPEPRFAANYKLNKSSSLKLSYNRMSQY